MRRADRLFQLVQLLRQRKTTTAAKLAQRLEVSERTIYRDLQDLSRSGVPVVGEAGVGYRLSHDIDLPPMLFDVEEIEALCLGVSMVAAWADKDLRQASRRALEKIQAVLPGNERWRVDDSRLFALDFAVPVGVNAHMATVRKAVRTSHRLLIEYCDAKQDATLRCIHPLGLHFWGKTWTIAAWCELRQGHRIFRLDRIADAKLDEKRFERIGDSTIEAFIASMQSRSDDEPQASRVDES